MKALIILAMGLVFFAAATPALSMCAREIGKVEDQLATASDPMQKDLVQQDLNEAKRLLGEGKEKDCLKNVRFAEQRLSSQAQHQPASTHAGSGASAPNTPGGEDLRGSAE